MTILILTILASLIPFGIWIYKRHAEKAASPLEQHRKKYEQIEKPIRKPDPALSDELDELDRLLISQHPVGESGPGGNPDGKGQGVHAGN